MLRFAISSRDKEKELCPSFTLFGDKTQKSSFEADPPLLVSLILAANYHQIYHD